MGQRYVQTLVDESFRGNMSGLSWAVPQGTPIWKLLLHFIWPMFKMEPVRQLEST